MDLGKQEALLREHPYLYRAGMVFECHDGWFDLIRKLSAGLEAFNAKQAVVDPESMLVALQVKEKFGGLRFYANSVLDEADALITDAENRSTSICELCGEPGRLTSKGDWMMTRCHIHLGESALEDQV